MPRAAPGQDASVARILKGTLPLGMSMASLEIRLLGPFDVIVDGDPAAGFESNSTRALLALLASEPGRVWSRPVLAEMLWPERPPGAALSNLRHVLSILRKVLADAPTDPRFLRADRNKLSLISSSELWVDSIEFERLAATDPDTDGAVAAWERAVGLWRGSFLQDLHVRAGAEWEEWWVVSGERLRRRLAGVLRALVTRHERAGDPTRALPFAQRLVEVDAYEERAHRQLMRLLASTGEAAKALLVYEDLHRRLDTELGTTPATETAVLAERIRADNMPGGSRNAEIVYPDFLTRTRALSAPSLFVGKEDELGQLEAHLQAALAGHGRFALIAGEAGSGKTMLAAEFAQRAIAARNVLVANGRCNAYGGFGDPYLPFREVLGLLTGKVESGFAAGTIGREQATRLWEAIPHTARLILERGPSLVGVMVNGTLLVERSKHAVPDAQWLDRLQARADAAANRPPAPERMQPALFDEYTAVLTGLTATHPLVVVVDDLQWADHGSIALLWHLARRLEGQRLLIVGLYRPEEIDGEHPLRQMLGELETSWPEGTVELGGDRRFIDAFLDSEPNRLDADFREQLHSYTDGHPLLTVEMVRGMQERAEIRRNRAGFWVTTEPPAWHRIPTRVEAVIAQRIGRLPDDLQADLAAAAVQGEEFIAETVAAVREDDDVAGRLRAESRMPHRLVAPSGALRIGNQLATKYRFRHILFQRYLYSRLAAADRLRLHELTGKAIEALFRDSGDAPVVDLAHHFDEAELVESAITYSLLAGQRAVRMAANEEAIRLLRRAVELVDTLPESVQRDERELEIRVSLAGPLMAVRGYGAPEALQNGSRLRELCNRLEPSLTVGLALSSQSHNLSVRASYADMEDVSRELVRVADKLNDGALRVLGGYGLGYARTWVGRLTAGHQDLNKAYESYDPDSHGWLRSVMGQAAGPEVLAWATFNTVYRGYPDQAVHMADEAISLARRIGPAWTLCHTLSVAGALLRLARGDYQVALEFVEEFGAIAAAEHMAFFEVTAEVHRGVIMGHHGDPDSGIRMIADGLEQWRRMGIKSYPTYFAADQAELEHLAGRTAKGLELLAVEKHKAARANDRLSAVRLAVTSGALLRAVGDAAAEEVLLAAIDDSRKIGSPALELRAATELALLLESQGRRAQAAKVLESAYGWFSEGFNTAALVDAERVLHRIRSN